MFLALLLVAGAAAPDAPADRAKQLFKEGAVAFEAGDSQTALGDFQQAYDLSHLDKLLYDIAQCERSLHDWPQAKADYEHYLSAVPDGKNHDLAVQHLAEVEQELALTAPPPEPPTPAVAAAPAEPSPALNLERPAEARPVPKGALWLGGAGAAVAIAGGLVWGIDALGAPTYAVSSVRSRDNAIGYAGQVALGVGVAALVAGGIWAIAGR